MPRKTAQPNCYIIAGPNGFFDNASEPPQLVFKDEAGRTIINDATLYENLRGQFGS